MTTKYEFDVRISSAVSTANGRDEATTGPLSPALLDQMHRYFLHTGRGLQRSRLVVPEPFFVHSELTTGVQLADLVAYVIAWAVRLTGQEEPRRSEMAELARLTLDLRYDTVRDLPRRPRFRIYGIARINDLRPIVEQDLA